MAFVIDGSEWVFDGWSADLIESAFGLLLERLAAARERHEQVWIGEDLHTRPVLGSLTVWDLWSPQCPVILSAELRQELAVMLDRKKLYVDVDVDVDEDEESWLEDWLEHTAVSISGCARSDNPDVAWAHHQVRSGRAVACLGLQRNGVHRTVTDDGEADVHWVIDETGHRAFFRAAIDVEHDSESTLQRMAPHAFPDIYFVDGVWRELGDFAGGYLAVRQQLRRHLATFDDYGYWAFTAPPPMMTEDDDEPAATRAPSSLLIQQRFQTHGVNLAPEAPNVQKDLTCRTARERMIGGRTLYCEWHAKLRGDQNRVHVHAPVPESGNKFVVAIFHAHLPLP